MYSIIIHNYIAYSGASTMLFLSTWIALLNRLQIFNTSHIFKTYILFNTMYTNRMKPRVLFFCECKIFTTLLQYHCVRFGIKMHDDSSHFKPKFIGVKTFQRKGWLTSSLAM